MRNFKDALSKINFKEINFKDINFKEIWEKYGSKTNIQAVLLGVFLVVMSFWTYNCSGNLNGKVNLFGASYKGGVASVGTIPAYSIRVGDYTVKLESLEQVLEVLNNVVKMDDSKNQFRVNLEYTTHDGTEAIIPKITRVNQEPNMINLVSISGAGVGTSFYPEYDIEEGIVGIDFAEDVIVYEVAASKEEVVSVEEATTRLTEVKEESQIYIVEPGDCIALIAQNLEMSVDKLIEINGFKDANDIIMVGQELLVTVPEPELPTTVRELQIVEEEYDEEVTYIYNDNWYTTDRKVIKEAIPGKRIATNAITYRNGVEKSKVLVEEVILSPAVGGIVEKGTKVPPTYIKPIRGGIFTSGFGARWGTVHKGVDWGCGIGTPVMASSAGVVSRAGWSDSYGYVVYIEHPDGKQTRYAHMSSVLVSVGQTVSQGQRVGLSGNTGYSTGPHLHFEILVNGKQVNPFTYI